VDNYRRMAILAAVGEHRSIRRAARELGLTPSAVSQQIRRLEGELGVSLLRRTTRSLSLTEAGEAFHAGCAAMVAGARQAVEGLEGLQERPIGELRVSAPAGFVDHLAAALAPFLAEHPSLALHLIVTDEAVGVVRERIDLAITLSRPLRDSGLVRRHLADWSLVLCASPDYLARRGTPRSPDDLAGHDLLSLPSGHHPTDVLTGPSGQEYRVRLKPRIISTNHHAIRQLTLMGAGLSFNVEPEVAEHLERGRLVCLLPDWKTQVLSVDALMPARTAQPAKVRLAIRALETYLAGLARRATKTAPAARSARAGPASRKGRTTARP
jgi:DNA-binding transcriptional LysR family regulator